jgi:hypothetical protein
MKEGKKTTSKGQPKNRAKAKQECDEKERQEKKTSLMVHDDEGKSRKRSMQASIKRKLQSTFREETKHRPRRHQRYTAA